MSRGMINYSMLTKEFLARCVAKQLSSADIALKIGGYPRTVRWYMKKFGVQGLKFKPGKPAWNKGLTASENEIVRRCCEAAHNATRGKPSKMKGVKGMPMSEERKLQQSLKTRGTRMGALSSNWKGGVSSQNKLLRKGWQFKEWRMLVFTRDNYTCQQCGTRGVELHPHHIKAFASYPSLRFDVDNGVTLCRGCHMATESWGNNKVVQMVA